MRYRSNPTEKLRFLQRIKNRIQCPILDEDNCVDNDLNILYGYIFVKGKLGSTKYVRVIFNHSDYPPQIVVEQIEEYKFYTAFACSIDQAARLASVDLSKAVDAVTALHEDHEAMLRMSDHFEGWGSEQGFMTSHIR